MEFEGPVVSDSYAQEPVLFLDIDGTIAHGLGNAIDRVSAELIELLVRNTGSVIVLCSDRVRSIEATMDELVRWISPHRFRGHCDPDPGNSKDLPSTVYGRGQITTSKVRRVVEWLDSACALGKYPPAWCVLDDCRTYSADWRTCTQHVKPSGPIVTTVDLTRAWGLLTRMVPRRHDIYAEAPLMLNRPIGDRYRTMPASTCSGSDVRTVEESIGDLYSRNTSWS